MKYGEIKWKIEKVVFKAKDGVVTQKSETDEGILHITKLPQQAMNIETVSITVHPG